MPTYIFHDEDEGIEFEEFMPMSELDSYKKNNPHLKQVPYPTPMVGDNLMGVGPKVDGGFTENMQRIAAAHPDSPMSDKWGGSTMTNTEIKTRRAIEKHAKKVEREGWSANKGKTLADK